MRAVNNIFCRLNASCSDIHVYTMYIKLVLMVKGIQNECRQTERQRDKVYVCVCVAKEFCVFTIRVVENALRKHESHISTRTRIRTKHVSLPPFRPLFSVLFHSHMYTYLARSLGVCVCACRLHSNNTKAQSIRLSIHECYGFMFVVLSLSD